MKDSTRICNGVLSKIMRGAVLFGLAMMPTEVNGGVTTEIQKLVAADAAADALFGRAVAFDGNTAIVGAIFDDCIEGYCGAAYVIRFNGTTWIEQQKLIASDAANGDWFGISLVVNGDTAAIGALGADCGLVLDCGAVYVFQFDGTIWAEQQRITATDPAQGAQFGTSLAISDAGDTLLVGAGSASCPAGIDCGSAYVFRHNGTSWLEEQKLTAPDAAQSDTFGGGNSVAVSTDTAIVGAINSDCPSANNCGAAYVFRDNGTTWVFQQKLSASDASANDNFGRLALSGDTLVVGAYNDSCAAGLACGSAYVFGFNGSTWSEVQKLTPADPSFAARFGSEVEIDGDLIAVGAQQEDCSSGFDCGSAYVFRHNGASWLQEGEFVASDAAEGASLGISVDIKGNTLIAGAIGADCVAGANCGAAYVFTLAAPECGNNVMEAGEQCDGTDDSGCPGACLVNCTCHFGPTLIGDTVDLSHRVPSDDPSDIYDGPYGVLVALGNSDQTLLTASVDFVDDYAVDMEASGFSVAFVRTVIFTAGAPFHGVVIEDLDWVDAPTMQIIGVTVSSSMEGFDPSRVTFGPDWVKINWQAITVPIGATFDIVLDIEEACESPHGDVAPPYCVVDVDDILYVLDGFISTDPCTEFPQSDLVPCGQPCSLVDVDDILSVLDAFAGIYSCP